MTREPQERKHLTSLELILDLDPNTTNYVIGVIEIVDLKGRYGEIQGIAYSKLDGHPLKEMDKRIPHYFVRLSEELKDKEEIIKDWVEESLKELYQESIPVYFV